MSIIESGNKTGKPLDKSYLEYNLPSYLNESLKMAKPIIEMIDNGVESKDLPSCWDCILDEFNADINCAEVDGDITSDQAWHLREKYFGRTRY